MAVLSNERVIDMPILINMFSWQRGENPTAGVPREAAGGLRRHDLRGDPPSLGGAVGQIHHCFFFEKKYLGTMKSLDMSEFESNCRHLTMPHGCHLHSKWHNFSHWPISSQTHETISIATAPCPGYGAAVAQDPQQTTIALAARFPQLLGMTMAQPVVPQRNPPEPHQPSAPHLKHQNWCPLNESSDTWLWPTWRYCAAPDHRRHSRRKLHRDTTPWGLRRWSLQWISGTLMPSRDLRGCKNSFFLMGFVVISIWSIVKSCGVPQHNPVIGSSSRKLKLFGEPTNWTVDSWSNLCYSNHTNPNL